MDILDKIQNIPNDGNEKLANSLCNPKDFNCDVSIAVTLYNSATFAICKSREDVVSIIKTNRNIEDVCSDDNYDYKTKSNEAKKMRLERLIFLKLNHLRSKECLHRLEHAIYQCISINGGTDAYGIIKFYDGNCLNENATSIYEDYVTPEFTIDVLKLEKSIKVICKKEIL